MVYEKENKNVALKSENQSDQKQENDNRVSQRDRVREIHEKLTKAAQDLKTSDDFKQYLAARSKFHDYSPNNRILIYQQRPDASYVAGYEAWKKLDRHVKPGAKGLQILQPTSWKKTIQVEMRDGSGKTILGSDGKPLTQEAEITKQGFKVGYVFAYEDTEGTPLPEIVHTLDAPVDDYHELMDIITTISPVPVEIEQIKSGANGFYSLENKDIHIKPGMPEMQTIKTTIHEIAHSMLHDKDTGIDKNSSIENKEVVAESVAYTVCDHLGLDTSDYSLGYIVEWSKGRELKELEEGLNSITETADKIITAVDEERLSRVMKQTDELAYKNGSNYVFIARVDDGYEFTAYDKDYMQTNSGMFKTTEARIDKAAESCMRYLGGKPENSVSYNVDSLKAKSEERMTVPVVSESSQYTYTSSMQANTKQHHHM